MHRAAYVRIKPQSVLNACGSRAHELLHDTTITRCEHDWPRRPISQNRRSHGLVDAKPSIAHDDGSDHTDDCKRADELATLLQTTKLLQPQSAAEAAKPCGGARLGGCQLQQQSQGGFEIIEMLTGGAPKVCGGRRT